MAKKNKTSTARETVYDRCAYVGCYNGKFINGRKLFHFPAETDRRLEMWIERSGNFRLRTWAATSLRKAGLCADHFDEKSFTNGTRKALRRNVVPRHYTEDFKYRRANGDDEERRRDDGPETSGAKYTEGTMSFEGTSSLGGFCEGPERVTRVANRAKKISQESKEHEASELGKTKQKSRSASPLVEFIVEELDEALILQESCSLVNGSAGEATENEDEGRASEEDGGNDESKEAATEPGTLDSRMSFDASDPEEISRSQETRAERKRARNLERTENPRGLNRDTEELEPEKESATPEKRTCCPYDDSCSNLAHSKTLRCLRSENKDLRRKIKLLKRNLRRRSSDSNSTKSATSKSIDDFLDIQECDNPATRALIKLSLHKPKCPFTKEEKKLAIQLYRNCAETFFHLGTIGRNFPGKNSIERWITEESYGNIVDDAASTDEIDDFHAPEAALVDSNGENSPSHENGQSQDSLTFDRMETEMHFMPETIDGVERVLESSKVLEAPPKSERDDREFFAPVNVAHETFS